MKRWLFLILSFLICIMVIRVGLGVTEDLHLSTVIEFLAQNNYGTDHLVETFHKYSEITDDVEAMNAVREDPEYQDMKFNEKVVYWLNLIGQYLRYIGNTVMILVTFIEMLLLELVYLMKIVVYLLFGISF